MTNKFDKKDWLALAAGAGTAALAFGLYTAAQKRYSFKGKVVLITGGSKGLGLVIARKLADEGAHLAICGRNHETLYRAEASLIPKGVPVLALPCDLNDPSQVRRLVQQVQQHYGKIDVLINNAGTMQISTENHLEIDDFVQAMGTHFWAPLHAILEVLPSMKSRRDGRIVNISSIGGKIVIPHMLPYCASKFALTALSEGLYAELKQHNISVTTVCPGLMRTGSNINAFVKGDYSKEFAWFSALNGLPLTSMSAEEAADKIIEACRNREPEIILTLNAKLASWFRGLFPSLFAETMGWMNSLLPAATFEGKGMKQGKFVDSPIKDTWVDKLNQKASVANNQL